MNVIASRWRAKAACIDSPPEWFVLPEGHQSKHPYEHKTKALCDGCLVKQECNDDARINRDVGVYRAGLELRRPLPRCKALGCTNPPGANRLDCSPECTEQRLLAAAAARARRSTSPVLVDEAPAVDECGKGHDLTVPENQYWRAADDRECAECRRITQRAYDARRSKRTRVEQVAS